MHEGGERIGVPLLSLQKIYRLLKVNAKDKCIIINSC